MTPCLSVASEKVKIDPVVYIAIKRTRILVEYVRSAFIEDSSNQTINSLWDYVNVISSPSFVPLRVDWCPREISAGKTSNIVFCLSKKKELWLIFLP